MKQREREGERETGRERDSCRDGGDDEAHHPVGLGPLVLAVDVDLRLVLDPLTHLMKDHTQPQPTATLEAWTRG
jgi:hypothetical protein